jgi:hypothetical protein
MLIATIGTHGAGMIATTSHSSDGCSNMSGPLVLAPSSDGLSNISGPLLLDYAVVTGSRPLVL